MKSRAALNDRFGDGGNIVTAWAPGRVNLIGEHTDYNDGFVMPVILGQGIEVSLRPRSDEVIRLFAADLDQEFEGRLGAGSCAEAPRWTRYLNGLTEELRQKGLVERGYDCAVSGTIPRASGLSSSAALETAAALALERAFGFALDPLDMALLCRDVEHRWVGVRCGIMDQMASRLGQPDHALLLDCRDLAHRSVPLEPDEHALVIIDSGVGRELATSAYNERRGECETGVALLAAHDSTVTSLRDVTPEFLAAHTDELPGKVAFRCRHVVEENARVLEAEQALAAGDLGAFGKLMSASHTSLRDLYEASHPAVDRLVAAAQETRGVLGSRLTGAGWGGCTVTFLQRHALPRFIETMEKELEDPGLRGRVLFITGARPAGILEDAT